MNFQSRSMIHQSNEKSDNSYKVGSQSSSNSSSASSTMARNNEYRSMVNQNTVPRTLRFVMQLVIGIFSVMALTSVISLSLTLSNMNESQNGVRISNIALSILNNIAQIRLLMRVNINIANGFSNNSNEIIDNRFAFYSNLVQDNVDEVLTH